MGDITGISKQPTEKAEMITFTLPTEWTKQQNVSQFFNWYQLAGFRTDCVITIVRHPLCNKLDIAMGIGP